MLVISKLWIGIFELGCKTIYVVDCKICKIKTLVSPERIVASFDSSLPSMYETKYSRMDKVEFVEYSP